MSIGAVKAAKAREQDYIETLKAERDRYKAELDAYRKWDSALQFVLDAGTDEAWRAAHEAEEAVRALTGQEEG